MEYKRFEDKIVARLDIEEEIIECLTKICEENDITLGTVSGIGATNKVKVSLLNTQTRQFCSKEFVGDYEVAPLSGNISTKDGKVYLHIHINLCDSNHDSFGGHLNYAFVSATFECVIGIIKGKVDRLFDENIGLNLLKFQNQ